jgi:RimJ/RimL family protein N-acetyltransferase
MTESTLTLRSGQAADATALLHLYQAVAREAGALARRPEELDAAYVDGILQAALGRGVWLVAEGAQGLIASIHASRPLPRDFQHVLGELTLVVHPRAQGQGLGRRLFTAFMDHVRQQEPGITRVELITRDSNARARRIYEQLGFEQEGRLRRRVRHADGRREDDLFYAWLRPEKP